MHRRRARRTPAAWPQHQLESIQMNMLVFGKGVVCRTTSMIAFFAVVDRLWSVGVCIPFTNICCTTHTFTLFLQYIHARIRLKLWISPFSIISAAWESNFVMGDIHVGYGLEKGPLRKARCVLWNKYMSREHVFCATEITILLHEFVDW